MRRISGEFRINPNITFFRQKEEIAEVLIKDFPDWETDSLSINLLNKNKKESIIIQHNKIIMVFDDVSSKHNFFDYLLKLLEIYHTKLPIQQINRTGIRFTIIEKTQLKFSELVMLLQQKYYQKNDLIEKILVTNYSDVAFSVDFEKEGFKFHYLIGPVNKKEAAIRFNSPFGIKDSELNDCMIYLDVDCYIDKPLDYEKAKNSIKAMSQISQNIVKESLKLFKIGA